MFWMALLVTAALAAVLACVTIWVVPRLWLACLEKDAPEPLRSMLAQRDASGTSPAEASHDGGGLASVVANYRRWERRNNPFAMSPQGVPGIENTRQRGVLCLRPCFLRVAFGCGSAFLCGIVLFSLGDMTLMAPALALGGALLLLAAAPCVEVANYRLVWEGDKVWYRSALGKSRTFTWDEATCVSRCPQELAVRFGKVRVECVDVFADRAYEEFACRHGGKLVFEPPHGYYSRTELVSFLLVIPLLLAAFVAAFLFAPFQHIDSLGSGPYEVTPTNVRVEDGVYHMAAPEHGPGTEWVWDDVLLGSADFVDVTRLREIERTGGKVLVWGYGTSIGTGTNNRFSCEQMLDQDGNAILSHDALVVSRREAEWFMVAVGGLLLVFLALVDGIYSLYHYTRQRRLPQEQSLEDFIANATAQSLSPKRRLL